MGTKFSTVYNSFFSKITDDLWASAEWTPEQTKSDLQSILLDAISGFELPRKNINKYTISPSTWTDNNNDNIVDYVEIDNSYFEEELTQEEINILAILMMCSWLQRQITSIENIRMKYSGSDFKFTSQANHLAKLLILQAECQRQSHHMQRLYKRRKMDKDGKYISNWSVFGKNDD